MAELEIVHETDQGEVIGTLDRQQVGRILYRRQGDVLVVLSTVTEPAYRGQGIAGALTRTLLDDANARGLRIRPICPYTAAYLDDHPEYASLRA